MKKLTTIYLAALLCGLFVLPVSSPAQTPQTASSEQVNRVWAVISAAQIKQKIPGLSVALVTGNQLRWSHADGWADLENNVPATTLTNYRLASVSKPITAVAVWQLASRGALDLDAPIQKYCPAFPQKPQPITARQLLGHLGGIRHYKSAEEFKSTRHFNSIVEALDPFKDDPLLHEPGTKFNYTTYGYVVLGCVIEGASKMKYADYLRENIFRPAGMEQTRVDDLYAIIPRRARGYTKTESGELRNADLADTSNKIPGGGLISNVQDLARFAIALNTGVLVKNEIFQQMQLPMKTTDGKESPYSGWVLQERKGEKILQHSGAQQGIRTMLYLIPSKGFALVLMANLEDVNVAELSTQIADILLP